MKVNISSAMVNAELRKAAREGHIDELIKRMEQGGDVNSQNRYNMTTLQEAGDFGHDIVFALILSKGASLDSIENALASACERGNESIVSLCLGRGASPNARSYRGTVLHSASWYGHNSIVQILLSHGGNIDAENDDDQKPLDLAKQMGRIDIIETIKKHKLLLGDNDEVQRHYQNSAGYYASCLAMANEEWREMTRNNDKSFRSQTLQHCGHHTRTNISVDGMNSFVRTRSSFFEDSSDDEECYTNYERDSSVDEENYADPEHAQSKSTRMKQSHKATQKKQLRRSFPRRKAWATPRKRSCKATSKKLLHKATKIKQLPETTQTKQLPKATSKKELLKAAQTKQLPKAMHIKQSEERRGEKRQSTDAIRKRKLTTTYPRPEPSKRIKELPTRKQTKGDKSSCAVC